MERRVALKGEEGEESCGGREHHVSRRAAGAEHFRQNVEEDDRQHGAGANEPALLAKYLPTVSRNI